MISKSSIACCLYPSPSIIAPSPEVKQRAFSPRSNRVWKSPDSCHSRTAARNRSFCCIALGLLLAQSGHSSSRQQCPLLGVKRTWPEQSSMSAYDPKRTFGIEFCCDAQDALVVFSYGPEFIDGMSI